MGNSVHQRSWASPFSRQVLPWRREIPRKASFRPLLPWEASETASESCDGVRPTPIIFIVSLLQAIKAMVLLIGNYPRDNQQSMHRFAMMMLHGLAAAGVPAELIRPQPFFGRFRYAGRFIAKWLAYIDKFVLFRRQLRRKLKTVPALVHICDHSNAMYAKHISSVPDVAN